MTTRRSHHPVTDCRLFYDRGDGRCLFCYNDYPAHAQLDGQMSIEDAGAETADV